MASPEREMGNPQFDLIFAGSVPSPWTCFIAQTFNFHNFIIFSASASVAIKQYMYELCITSCDCSISAFLGLKPEIYSPTHVQ